MHAVKTYSSVQLNASPGLAPETVCCGREVECPSIVPLRRRVSEQSTCGHDRLLAANRSCCLNVREQRSLQLRCTRHSVGRLCCAHGAVTPTQRLCILAVFSLCVCYHRVFSCDSPISLSVPCYVNTLISTCRMREQAQ